MSAITSSEDIKNKRISSHWHRHRAMVIITIGLALIPFIPATLKLIVGLVAGVIAARHMVEAYQLKASTPHDDRYQAIEMRDGQLVEHVYIGHGMDFSEFRAGLDEIARQDGELTSNQRRQYAKRALERMTPVFLQDDLATRHLFVGGSTGVGKTELFTSILFQDIKRGGGGIIYDAKGDEKLLTRIYAMAKKFNREDDLLLINFDRPEISHTYNPIINGNARQIISTLMKLQGETSEEFFRRLNRNALSAAIVCLLYQKEKVAFNFTDLAVMFNDIEVFVDLYNSMDPLREEERQFVFQFLDIWRGYDNRQDREYFKVELYKERLLGLFGICMDFAHSEYRAILNDYNPDIELKRCIEENKIVVIAVPALSDKEGVVMFARLFMADLARAIGQIQLERTKPLIPYRVYLDEYGSFKDPNDQELFQLARSAGIGLILSVQGRGFLADASEMFADNLLTNCWTHIYFDVRDPKTRENASALAGSVVRRFAQDSQGENFGFSHDNAETGNLRTENQGESISYGYKETREELLQPDDFALDEGEALMIGKTGVTRLRMPLVNFGDDVPPLEDIELPHFEKTRVHGLDLMAKAMEARGDFKDLL